MAEWMGSMNRRDFSRLVAGASLSSEVKASLAEPGTTLTPAQLSEKLRPGVFKPGKYNGLTDVAGVAVGHTTLIEGESIRTGVTAILPHGGNLFQQKLPGAVYVGNAFGKLAGSTQVNELGNIETPIVLTNTLSVSAGIEALVRYTLKQQGNESVVSVNALVGETNDSVLNDIRALRVRVEDVTAALTAASSGPVEQGSVGAGTGTVCFGWKGGIGTASRVLPARYGGYTVAALLQTNFGGLLTMSGLPVGRALGNRLYPADGSCMIVLATDAPLGPRNLSRLAKRGVFGLARTGSAYSNGSGDFAIAFSTAAENRVGYGDTGTAARQELSNDAMSPLFEASLEVVEESVYNSLLFAKTMTGNGSTIEALPLDRLSALLMKS
jgi:D-aminopeptidase